MRALPRALTIAEILDAISVVEAGLTGRRLPANLDWAANTIAVAHNQLGGRYRRRCARVIHSSADRAATRTDVLDALAELHAALAALVQPPPTSRAPSAATSTFTTRTRRPRRTGGDQPTLFTTSP